MFLELSALKGKEYVKTYECDVVKRGSVWVGACRARLGRDGALRAWERLEPEGAPRERRTAWRAWPRYRDSGERSGNRLTRGGRRQARQGLSGLHKG